jgi:hypothetical protein
MTPTLKLSNHGDALVGRGLQLSCEGRAVDRGDDEKVGAVGDHLVDLLRLRGDVVACVLQVDRVAVGLEASLHCVAVGNPPLRGLSGHRHANAEVASRGSRG